MVVLTGRAAKKKGKLKKGKEKGGGLMAVQGVAAGTPLPRWQKPMGTPWEEKQFKQIDSSEQTDSKK